MNTVASQGEREANTQSNKYFFLKYFHVKTSKCYNEKAKRERICKMQLSKTLA
jgi:hypothetical protein